MQKKQYSILIGSKELMRVHPQYPNPAFHDRVLKLMLSALVHPRNTYPAFCEGARIVAYAPSHA